MDQVTSSQQAIPSYLRSQGLYALRLDRVGEGVRSLSARSFKVRHVMHGVGVLEEERECTLSSERISKGSFVSGHMMRHQDMEGSDKAETK
jgi:hypothetical protein